MANYQVFMGQGAVVNLDQHTLYTGPPPEDNSLQFCTAVIFINTKTKMAALYHYRSGAFKKKHEDILVEMLNDVDPDVIALRTGATRSRLAAVGHDLPILRGDVGVPAMLDFLRYSGQGIDVQEAITGAATVRLEEGVPRILLQHPSGGLDPLKSWLAGDYPARGVKVYGKAK